MKISFNKEQDTKKLNKIEDEQLYIPINNTLLEDNRIILSVKQTPSMPTLNNFILEGLKPIKIEKNNKNEPKEIIVPCAILEKKEHIPEIPETIRKIKHLEDRPADE